MANNRTKGLIRIFRPNGRDWMLYKVTKDNPYTFHHIEERKNGGQYTTDNGALLTRNAHQLLNMMEKNDIELYEMWQELFRKISATKTRPTMEHIARMKELRLISKGRGYE